MVRGARVPGGGDPARPGRAGLGPGRPAARRSLARPAPGRAGRHRPRAAGRVPAEARAADAELAALAAADELAQGSLEAAERYLGLASAGSASVPDARRGQVQLLLGVVRLLLARQRGNLPAVAEEARRLQAAGRGPGRGAARPGRGPARAGADQPRHRRVWTARFEEAERHLEQGVALARRIGRPFLEFTGLAHQAAIEIVPVVCAGGGAQQAGDRAGRTARLDRRAGRRHRLRGTRSRAGRGRGGWRRQSPGSSAPSAPSEPKPSPRRR